MLSHEWGIQQRYSQDREAVLDIARCPGMGWDSPRQSYNSDSEWTPEEEATRHVLLKPAQLGLGVIPHSSQIYKSHICTLHIGMYMYTWHSCVHNTHTCTHIYINFSHTWTHRGIHICTHHPRLHVPQSVRTTTELMNHPS